MESNTLMVTHCVAAGPANFALPAVGVHGGRGEKKKQQAFPIEHNTGLPFSRAFFFTLLRLIINNFCMKNISQTGLQILFGLLRI